MIKFLKKTKEKTIKILSNGPIYLLPIKDILKALLSSGIITTLKFEKTAF